METQVKLELCFLIFVLILARIFFLIHKITTGFSKEATNQRMTPCKTVICMGSGGHTTEMLNLVESLSFSRYTPRYYIMARSDTTSAVKVESVEHSKPSTHLQDSPYYIVKIPRSRVVGQSYITSVATTLYSVLYTVPLVLRIRPDLILCNGPGTCIPVCVIGFILKAAFITDTRIVFIESFCRTESFSLSGRILMYFADNFLVQWPNLKQKLKRAEYIGQLM